ncbi:MAG TPA: hypothetical protein VFW00_13705, partial [Rhodocyclaceae bacterium]|nr:hypothetical protein [Rhodocyclaceae bacterium]
MKFSVLSASLMTAGLLLTSCSMIESWRAPAASSSAPKVAGDIGRQALPANDGWAADGTGTDGGSKAKPENVYTVSTRADLV